MIASSSFFFGVVSLAVLLPFLLLSASATSYIDAICSNSPGDKAFCAKTLSAYPPAASATSTLQAAVATLRLGMSYANKSADIAGTAEKENPKLKGSQDAFLGIIGNLKSSTSELTEDPQTANYDAMVCYDNTKILEDLVGKNKDKASTTIFTMTVMMNKLIDLTVGATIAIGG
ncbi:PREDICTED: uncharacterized protein LOC104724663 [Camelina sativa]|uniref:Uncharacterized protein LOC104724663 n=1 Tax=Camelina sativa TaxID=90675 RepID=A0ABM0UI62_CAMSA|nr:PREDICTED: uncharacterized protein LOC104724663 [Camelina sativa]